MKNKIKLDDVREGKISLGEAIERVRNEVNPADLFADSLHGVAKAGLTLFDFPALKDDAAAEAAAKELVSIFYPLGLVPAMEYIKKFNEVFLNLQFQPTDLKQQIGAPAKAQLQELDQLIAYYETRPVISANEIPRNHRDYWMVTFYQRTKAKRQVIQDYLDQILEPTVLRFAKPGYRETWHGSGGAPDGIMELKDKYPYLDMVIDSYHIALRVDMEKLDWRKLNPLRNKIFAHSFQADYSQGYTAAINREIMTDLDALSLLDKLIIKIGQFPKIRGRKEIFEQLKALFTAGQWYGFYALALPQVEGIFAEMSLLIDEQSSTTGSLSDKVKRLRPFSEENEFYFDYYEFYLPEARNKFSHTGKDSDIELKSRYMLLDMSNLLTTCEGLNTPLVHLINILSDGAAGLRHIGDLAKLIRLVDETKSLPVYQEINAQVEELVYQQIPAEWDLAGYFTYIQIAFDHALSEFSNWVRWEFLRNDLPEKDFRAMTPREVFENIGLIETTYQRSGVLFADSFKYLLDVPVATLKLLRLFPDQPKAIADAIRDFGERNRQSLANLDKLSREATFEETPDDYFIEKQKRTTEWERFNKILAA